MEPNETVVSAWARLNRAQHLAFTSIENALKANGMPPLAWYDVLLELSRVEHEGLRPFELERHVLFAQYNLSRLLGRIENAGYIERCPCEDDGRGQIVKITSAGIAIRHKMWPVYADAISRALGDHFSEREAEQLNTLLGNLIGHGQEKAQ